MRYPKIAALLILILAALCLAPATSILLPQSESFAASPKANISIIAPNEASTNSPVIFKTEGLPAKCRQLWRYPEGSTWIELYDRDGNPINIFWHTDAGTYKFELIVGVNGKDVPDLYFVTHTLKYGETPVPPVPDIPTPSVELQKTVEPLVAFVNGVGVADADKKLFKNFYKDFSEVIATDTLVTDTAAFRQAYIEAGKLALPNQKGRYPGLANIIDKILSDTLGLDVVPLEHARCASVLQAIAWAFTQ